MAEVVLQLECRMGHKPTQSVIRRLNFCSSLVHCSQKICGAMQWAAVLVVAALHATSAKPSRTSNFATFRAHRPVQFFETLAIYGTGDDWGTHLPGLPLFREWNVGAYAWKPNQIAGHLL